MTQHTPAQKSGGSDVLAFIKSFWLPILLVVVAIIFISTNTNRTDFTVLWVTINAPLWLMLTITVLVGFVAGWFVGRRRKD
ncbi:MAG: LapA family protein [Gordonia sp. (in: high G+C Gram-positive bacteria)]